MAVPKKKTTPSKRGMRNSHNSLKAKQLTECKDCGELKLPHHVCEGCGYYNGKKIIITRKEKRASKENKEEE